MVALRLRYLQQSEGVEPHTALVQDIPGVHYGSILHRCICAPIPCMTSAHGKQQVESSVGRSVLFIP
jgi:hypothetical protein